MDSAFLPTEQAVSAQLHIRYATVTVVSFKM